MTYDRSQYTFSSTRGVHIWRWAVAVNAHPAPQVVADERARRRLSAMRAHEAHADAVAVNREPMLDRRPEELALALTARVEPRLVQELRPLALRMSASQRAAGPAMRSGSPPPPRRRWAHRYVEEDYSPVRSLADCARRTQTRRSLFKRSTSWQGHVLHEDRFSDLIGLMSRDLARPMPLCIECRHLRR